MELVDGAAPSFIRSCARAHPHEEKLPRQVNELLKKGKAQESTRAFGRTSVLARKKDGSWRMCINFKLLNNVAVKQQFPRPRIEELLERLQGSAVCSTFEFTDASLAIPIPPDDRHITAFHTRSLKLDFI